MNSQEFIDRLGSKLFAYTPAQQGAQDGRAKLPARPLALRWAIESVLPDYPTF